MDEAIEACLSRLKPYFERGTTEEKLRPYLESLYRWGLTPTEDKRWVTLADSGLLRRHYRVQQILLELFVRSNDNGC